MGVYDEYGEVQLKPGDKVILHTDLPANAYTVLAVADNGNIFVGDKSVLVVTQLHNLVLLKEFVRERDNADKS